MSYATGRQVRAEDGTLLGWLDSRADSVHYLELAEPPAATWELLEEAVEPDLAAVHVLHAGRFVSRDSWSKDFARHADCPSRPAVATGRPFSAEVYLGMIEEPETDLIFRVFVVHCYRAPAMTPALRSFLGAAGTIAQPR